MGVTLDGVINLSTKIEADQYHLTLNLIRKSGNSKMMSLEEFLIIIMLIIAFLVIHYVGGHTLYFPLITKYLRKHDKENYKKRRERKWRMFYLDKLGIVPLSLLLPYWGFALGFLASVIFASLSIITGWFVFRPLIGISYATFLISLFYQVDKVKRKRMR